MITLVIALAAPAAWAIDATGTVSDGSGAGWPLWARITLTPTGPGTPIVTYTDPADGSYEILGLPGDTEFNFLVEALIPGYLDETRMVMTPGGKNFIEDFELEIDGAVCTAPGYATVSTPVLSEDFSGGIPGTWTVVDNTTACGGGPETWGTNDTRPLFPVDSTVVTPLFALMNSDECGSAPAPNVQTDLVTPSFDLSGLGGAADALSISFNSDYRDLCTVANTDAVSLDVWNGSAWVTVFDFCGQTNRRNRAESFATQAANGVSDARFRFHYDSGWDWWWAIDDVEIATTSCEFQGGGLIWGFVTDINTGEGVVGATVTVEGGDSTTTEASADPEQEDGIYFVYADAGNQTVTASAPNYGDASEDVNVVASSVVRLDLELLAGLLVFDPNPVTVRVPLFTTLNLPASVDNEGSADASWALFEVNAPAPKSPITGIIENAPLRVSNDNKALTFAPTTRDFPSRPTRELPPIAELGGEVTGQFDTGLPGGPYGNALVHEPSLSPVNPVEVWLGNVAAIAGDDELVQYNSNGVNLLTPTGTVVTPPPGAVFWADATYNARTETFWQVNVGGDNCIHEFTASGFTGETICPPFATSMRGLTYDSVTDTYYSGSFNDGAIVQFTPDGTILRTVAKDIDVVGLAINPLSGRLYAMQNTASPESDIVVVDANTPTFDIINAFDFAVNGVGVMGDFEQGGLEIDCHGRLWGNNFVTGRVYVADSGETKACPDIPWLSASPTEGTTPAGGSTPVTLTFDANLARPGFHQAHLVLTTDTPTGDEIVPVNFTAAFLDVAPSNPFDRFIHGLAGAGITVGCGAGNYCPNAPVTRGLMPVWLLPAKNGTSYQPPPATGTLFADVPAESFGAAYIEQFYHLGITAGCGTNPLRYCPSTSVTRGQMAVFLLLTFEGPGYTPPPATGIFNDVPPSNPLAPWIEELFNRGITAGCGGGNFCPGNPVSRGQMAVFITTLFGIPVAPAP